MPAKHLNSTHTATALLVVASLASCQITDAISQAMRPQADHPDAQQGGAGPFGPEGSAPYGEFAASGSELEGVEVIERPDEAARASYARLFEARLGLPPRPTPPPAPRLVPVPPERAVNTEVQLSTSGPHGAASLVNGGAASHHVAVTSGDDRGCIEPLNAVPNFVADVFYGRLQRHGLAVLDCEYPSGNRAASGTPIESAARRSDSNQEPHPSAERAAELGADHLIILHAVPRPGAMGGISVHTVILPLEVDDASWAEYETSASAYVNEVAVYNAAVKDYDTVCREVQVALGSRLARLGYNDLPKAVQDERALRALKTQVEVLLATPSPAERAPIDPLPWSERLMLDGGLLGAEVNAELMRAAILARNADPRADGPSHQPAPIVDAERHLIRTKDEALFANLSERHVEAFEFAISVRVIDLESSKTEWFGMATCRDLSMTSAVERTCDSLLAAMLRP